MNLELILLFIGGCFSVVGLAMAGFGWQQRKHHQLVTGTPTTDIRSLDSEGLVELQGTISEPASESGFVSPIGQTTNTIFATWAVEEWSHDSSRDKSTWANIAGGIDSVPFYLDDGTGQVRVEIGDRSSDVTQEFEEIPIVEEVNIDAQPPAHIRTFDDEHSLSKPEGASGNLLSIGKNDYGDRHYSERALPRAKKSISSDTSTRLRGRPCRFIPRTRSSLRRPTKRSFSRICPKMNCFNRSPPIIASCSSPARSLSSSASDCSSPRYCSEPAL